MAALLFLSEAYSCNHNAGTPSSTDSTSVRHDTSATIGRLERSNPFSRMNVNTTSPLPITDSEVTLATSIHDSVPCFRDSNGVPIRGFFFIPEDLKGLTGLKPKALFFRMGISNYKDSNGIKNGTIKPQYTIIVEPLDTAKPNIGYTRMNDAAGKPIAYDFVCPCPSTASCCPKN